MDTRLKLKIQEQFQIIVHGPYMLKAHLDKHLSIDLHENHCRYFSWSPRFRIGGLMGTSRL